MMKDIPPPGDPVWASVRLRYEQDQETVAAIAQELGLSGIRLSTLAKQWGWALRGKVRKALKRKSRKPTTKMETTAATIKRLKEILQQRVSQLEDQLKEIGADVTALSNERDMRATSTLVRTLEKVLDLERKDRNSKRKQAREFKYFDDEQRRQLADKIERLERTWEGQANLDNAADRGRGGVEQPVALLGAATPATAATGN
jgi:DNA-binding transcriptional MerR regulator